MSQATVDEIQIARKLLGAAEFSLRNAHSYDDMEHDGFALMGVSATRDARAAYRDAYRAMTIYRRLEKQGHMKLASLRAEEVARQAWNRATQHRRSTLRRSA